MKDDPGSAAAQAAQVVAGTMAPFGCLMGCASALLWLIGGAVVGTLVAFLLRHS